MSRQAFEEKLRAIDELRRLEPAPEPGLRKALRERRSGRHHHSADLSRSWQRLRAGS